MVRDTGKHTLALDLHAIVIKGKPYSIVICDVTKHGAVTKMASALMGGRRSMKAMLCSGLFWEQSPGGKGAGVGLWGGEPRVASAKQGRAAARFGSRGNRPDVSVQRPFDVAPARSISKMDSALVQSV